MTRQRPSSHLVRWQLEASDTFDPEARPLVDASGQGLLEGLQLLWEKTLDEGVMDNGSGTFTRFRLCWQDRGGPDSTCLGVQPFDNRELALLRSWLGYHHATRSAVFDPVGLLPALAGAHAALLGGNSRHTGGWQASSEASSILRLVSASNDPQQLLAALGRIGS